ncbi:MAG TPA: hypothetical protein VHK23_09650 [Miltoncostaeaceae bacterium]|jgi:hypothetical protein|nr:hypothetical protein [Miltoncostaeaceae bacterium]
MARWGLWTASAIGAAGAGAALALMRRRRPGGAATDAGPAEAGAAAEAAAAPPPEDPREALDAARDRLRARADALREEIARRGENPAGG